ncbi:probable UDP-3-O-acylglucosamine N-acyltransferase 2, mitochondrial [Diospyros lotus]|uniref:probable UDP-3-O-acylglucosamine N-acyltransferase 2, mitochondrial n=1 Tax=Diospyros lotus TaxID=55363 RepID=UPI002256B108|nr:probable UDP-3-O-acylglucosamine N-acyltransferase 2, mitochondrial [Diospyros lotus]
MARYLRRSASIGSSNPVFNFLLKTAYVEESRAFLYRGSIFSSHRISSNHFSVCSTDQSESKFVPRNLDVNAGRGDEGFRKWHNGGGTFHKSACIDATALIEIGAVVHPKAVISANAQIGSGAIIGPAVTVGQSTKIGYNVALSNCTIGDSCVIHNGVCIGQDGFGFFLDEHGDMVKKPQLLKVLIGHHVEIGANSCIDRGSWRDTTIGDHTKIDNLVQIAHNAVIGKCCILCGQVGIAGSVIMGDNVTLGGRVAIRDHVSIASKVRLAATSCVTKDIKESGDYGGFPAVPIREWRRQVAINRRTQK